MTTLGLVQTPNRVVDILSVLVNAHLGESRQLLLLRQALQSICQRDQVLEGTSEEPSSLLVLSTQPLQILFDLRGECRRIEVLGSGEVGLDRPGEKLD